MKMFRPLTVLLPCLVLMAPDVAAAMKVSPFKVKFEPDGDLSSQLFYIENDSGEKIAVELSAQTRDVDADGRETNRDASGDFSIYPSQVIIAPHTTRSVRVQWIGQAPVTTEKAYRLTAEELPVDLDPAASKASAVRFLLQYRCAVYITPPGARSDIRMISHDIAPTSSGRRLDFILENDGTAHSLIKNFVLTLTDGAGHTIDLKDASVLATVNSEVLMPKSQRKFSIVLPASAPADIKAVDFKFTEAF